MNSTPPALGWQWQWQANPSAGWAFPSVAKGSLRLFAAPLPDSAHNLWEVAAGAVAEVPAPAFQATTKLRFAPRQEGDRISFVVMGADYAGLSLTKEKDGIWLSHVVCKQADKGAAETRTRIMAITSTDIFFRVEVSPGGSCRFSYSTDGQRFQETGDAFTAAPGRWIGAKIGYCAARSAKTNDAGWADVDWFRVTAK